MLKNEKKLVLKNSQNCEGYIVIPRWLDAAAYANWVEITEAMPKPPSEDDRYRAQLSFVIASDVWFMPDDEEERFHLPHLATIENPSALPYTLLMEVISEIVKLLTRNSNPKNSQGPSETTPSKPAKSKEGKKKK